jgi:small subunit ribosomal protein S9
MSTETSEQATTEAAAPAAPPAAPTVETPVLDIGSQAAEAPAAKIEHVVHGQIAADGTAIATGRRKTSVARVRVKKGTGVITINDRALDDFFRVERDRADVLAPLKATQMEGQVDVWVRVNGGGTTGQSGAVMLGVARALHALNHDLHGALSEKGFLTRDDRMVERKKYGHRKARRSFQFSKR